MRCQRKSASARRLAAALLSSAALLALVACEGGRTDLLLASTTSTEDSGLFDLLLPAFMEDHPEVGVQVTAVGSGQALELGRRGDADVLLVHAPAAESAFVADGYGEARCEVMYNDFVVVGPASDPADVAGLRDATEAFRRIASTGSEFISRGDDSGTHRKEQSIWDRAGVQPAGSWYMEVGQGMAESLRMAVEQRAYALTDRATLLNQRGSPELEILVQGDDRLFNQYAVIPVVRASQPGAGRTFARWITSPRGQAVIGEYGQARFGEPLFVPNARGCALP